MNTRHLFWQFPMLIVLTSPLWHGPASRFLTLEHRVSTTAPVHQDSSFTMEDVAFYQVKRGADDLLLRAKRLRGAGDDKGYELEEADAKRLGSSPVHIISGNAHYDPERQILTMLDKVVVQTADLVVRTVAMRYLAKFDTIKSAAEVEMIGNGFNITGTSFMYNLTNRNLRVGKRVRFLYTPPPSPQSQGKQALAP